MKNKNCPNNSKNTTLSKQFQKYYIVRTNKKILHCPNNSKNTTLSEQFQKYHIVRTNKKILHCPNNSKNTTLFIFPERFFKMSLLTNKTLQSISYKVLYLR